MSDKTAIQAQSPTGFQATIQSDQSKSTSNAWLIIEIAKQIKDKTFWKRLELNDGREVFALCFPTNVWTSNTSGQLVERSE
jgi:hypothetical protein